MFLSREKILLLITTILASLAAFFSCVIFLMVTDRFPRKAEVFVAEEYKKPNITVDVSTVVGKVEAPWSAFAQGGEEMNNPMLAGTENLMQQIKPSYVRLDHIFDDDYYGVVSRKDGKLELNWSKLDDTINSITKMGAKPFFSLGYMPSELASSKIDKPRNWEEWQWLIEQTILHYSGKDGKAIDNVYYEVWNEPDLGSFGSWKYSGDKNYLDLYSYAAKGAKSARANSSVKPFKFGGPAITALYKNWVMAVVNFSRQQNLPLDFISWHRYSYSPLQFSKDIEDAKSWLGDGNKYELIISEWGPDSEKTAVYSGYSAGAHAISVMRQVLGDLKYGFAFEVKDGPGQGNLGWGLFTHDTAGIKAKPRYQAFAFLKDMNGQRLNVTGEGSSVVAWAVGEKGKYNMVLSNFELGTNVEEDVPVKFINLNPGQYRLSWGYLSGKGDEKIFNISNEQSNISQQFKLKSGDALKIHLTLIESFAKIDSSAGGVESTAFGKLILDY